MEKLNVQTHHDAVAVGDEKARMIVEPDSDPESLLLDENDLLFGFLFPQAQKASYNNGALE